MTNGRELSLPIVGIAYANKDGSNRRFAVMTCLPGDPLHLVPEPRNRIDPHAVAVRNARGEQLGYLPAERAPWIGSKIRAGVEVSAIFQQETPTGAILRIRLGEGVPTLPAARERVEPSEPRAITDWDAVDPDGPEWGA